MTRPILLLLYLCIVTQQVLCSLFVDVVDETTTTLMAKFIDDVNNDTEASFVLSPYSIVSVMTMFYYGTSHDTEMNVKEVVMGGNAREAMTESLYDIHKSFAMTANLKFFQTNYNLILEDAVLFKSFTEEMRKLGNKVKRFSPKNGGELVNKLNKKIAKKTNNMIVDFLPSDFLHDLSFIAWVNVAYFKASWKHGFDKAKSQVMDFHHSQSNASKQMFMISYEEDSNKYFENDRYQVLEKQYSNEDFVFSIILPRENNDLILPKSTDERNHLFNNLKDKNRVKLETIAIPIIESNIKYDLKRVYEKIGLRCMAPNAPLYMNNMANYTSIEIDKFIHQAAIRVNEKGTEASAATVLSITFKSKQPPKPRFIADRPFTYYIRHAPTGMILFAGVFR